MVTIRNVLTFDGKSIDHNVPNDDNQEIDCHGALTLFPALVDIAVQFETEDWKTAAQAAFSGGVTTVFDIPGSTTAAELKRTSDAIERQLEEASIPLHYRLYLSANPGRPEELIPLAKKIAGLKVSMPHAEMDRTFRQAAQANVIILVDTNSNPSDTEQALILAEKYGNTICFLNVVTKEELTLIAAAKKKEILVYCHTSTPSLIQTPFLFDAINRSIIDMIGSGHTPRAPSIQQHLPTLLKAAANQQLSLEKIVELTNINPNNIFNLNRTRDCLLVDLKQHLLSRTITASSACG